MGAILLLMTIGGSIIAAILLMIAFLKDKSFLPKRQFFKLEQQTHTARVR